METETLLKKRFIELAQKAYQNSQFMFTGFLSLSDRDIFYRMEKELAYVPYQVYGGGNDCERVMIRFGNEELFGYEEEFPITCIQAKPLARKFADDLGHRDFLGALMNLGIERSVVGDIWIKDNAGYIFCTRTISPFIIENLDKIKHTTVGCKEIERAPETDKEELCEITIQISSERIDGVVSKVHKISRNESIEAFRQKKVFINGRLCENNSHLLKENDAVTVRGLGKFIYTGNNHYSKKGKINAAVLCYSKR